MQENTYIQNLLNGLGLAINEEKNNEIVVNFPFIFDKKNMQYLMSNDYKIITQPLGTFLVDFINSDFNIYSDFVNFFNKYSLSLINYDKTKNIFQKNIYANEDFNSLIKNIHAKNKNKLIALQEQVDMILDYCILNPRSNAIKFTPIERMYVLRRTDASLPLLTSNKTSLYTFHAFSSYPGDFEDDIYNFLSQKKNKVTEVNLILPYNISSILYKEIVYVLNEQIYLKICKNCNKYYIASNKSSDYCNNIAPNSKKTCKEIGKTTTFKNNMQNDPALALYYKIYNRKIRMKTRYPDIKQYAEQFDLFKQIGKVKLDKYKAGKISSELFIKWLNKNS